jgi:hypothetical protein
MGESNFVKKRRTFRWSRQARELVSANLKATGYALRQVITQLVEMTGYPRSACRRFAYKTGNKSKGRHKRWPVSEQQRLLELLDKYTIAETAQRMRCSRSAIYGMLRRMKIPAALTQDNLSKSKLAALLRVHVDTVNSWIQNGWLTATPVQAGKVNRTVIKPDDLFEFCEKHRDAIIGNRLNLARLEFVYKYVFPPDHNYLLSVREHKKQRNALGNQAGAANAPHDHPQPVRSQSENSDGKEVLNCVTIASEGCGN